MPNVFGAIRDKTVARVTRAQRSKSSHLHPQTQISNDGHTSQDIVSGARSTLTPTPTAVSGQAADPSHRCFPISSHSNAAMSLITRAAEPFQAVATDAPQFPQMPVSDDISITQTIDIGARVNPHPPPTIELNQVVHAPSTVLQANTSDQATTLGTRVAESAKLAAVDVGNASLDRRGDMLSPVLSSLAVGRSGVAYEGFKTILRGVNDSAVMFPPLKTAAAALLSVLTTVDVCASLTSGSLPLFLTDKIACCIE